MISLELLWILTMGVAVHAFPKVATWGGQALSRAFPCSKPRPILAPNVTVKPFTRAKLGQLESMK